MATVSRTASRVLHRGLCSGSRRLLLALLLVVGATVGVTQGASAAALTSPAAAGSLVAAPMAPWDCKSAPTPSLPDTGLPGFFDPPPVPPPPAGDPWATNRSTTLYDQYGYAGLSWSTYDTGCLGGVGEMDATIDTFLGNLFMSGGTWVTSATNGIHNRVAHPEQYMQPLDDVVAAVTTRLHDAIWSPWGTVSFLAVAALLLFYSLHGRLSAVIAGAAWAIFVLAVLAGVSQYPTRVATFFDQAVGQSIATVNQTSAGLTPSAASDPARAQGALIVDGVLYQAWLRGQFGDPDSPAAKRWGPVLFREATFSRAELATAQSTPDGVQQMTEQKANDWAATTAQIQNQDPLAYAAVQGTAKGRAGAAFLAFVGAAFTALFRLIADTFIFAGLVMLRLLVMFFPAAAVVGVIAPMSSIVRRIGNIAGACVINVIAFSTGAAIHGVAIGAIISRANSASMGILSLILCLVVSLAAFILLMPLLSFSTILGQSTRGHSMLRTARRSAQGYLLARKAVGDGTDDAGKKQGTSAPPTGTPGTPPHETAGGAPDAGPVRYVRRVNLPPESIGRRFDTTTTTQPDVPDIHRELPGRPTTARAALPSSTGQPALRGPDVRSKRAAQPASTASVTDQVAPAGAAIPAPPSATTSRPGSHGTRTSDLYDPRSGATAASGVKQGPIVDDLPSGIHEVTLVGRPHDSHSEVTEHGIRTRFFDPDTKSMVTTNPDQNVDPAQNAERVERGRDA